MCWRAAQKLIHHWKILRGDNIRKRERIIFLFVMVTRGKDRWGIGVFKHVIFSQNHLIVEGKNQDTPMDLVLEKTYDAKTGKSMPDPINLLFNFIGDI
ncbi:hypothetical protein LOK49_LG06G00933 [Camellia lanceoleosa]|uniref:Uncharacterized protein n=1 Tax=Camellia lanceoleosa TaxID=1840588 RepID=A0ACC0H8X9_9ERIC|nr:hypothetical protein LOK49_LG06G00933 [Camellia lanceoleosa]